MHARLLLVLSLSQVLSVSRLGHLAALVEAQRLGRRMEAWSFEAVEVVAQHSVSKTCISSPDIKAVPETLIW